jgi:cytochrome b
MMREARVSMRVWDGPIRLFHWGVVALVFTSWLTQHENWMAAHLIAGYTMFAALLFRLAWGVIGSDTARFRNFLRSPLAAFGHLRRFARPEPDREIGHNAAGGWMVLALLLLLAVQVGTGLCTNNQVDVEGPLAQFVGQDWSDWLTHVHAATFKAIEAAVLLHVAAVLAYALLKRQDLVRPMITGRKLLPATMPPPRLRSPLLALLVLAVAGGIVAFLVMGQ